MSDDNKYGFTIQPSDSAGQQPESGYQGHAPSYYQTTPPAPRKSRTWPKIVALCLVITLLAGTAGGIMGYYFSRGDTPAATSTPNASPVAASDDSSSVIASSSVKTNSLSISEIYNVANPSVVAISTEGTTTNVFGQSAPFAAAGSGFIISSDGYIATNAHVIQGSNSITIMLYDGTEKTATIVGQDTATDLAVLKIDASGLTAVSFGDSSALKVGDLSVAIGNPLGEFANSLTVGYISALDREINIDGTPRNMLQFDAAVSPGNSGGPLFDQKGNVVGIVSAKSSGSGVEGIGFAIPINDAMTIINELIDNGYISGRAQLGIIVRTDYTESAANYYNMPVGCYIQTVESGGAAERAGLQAGDIITAIDGTALTGYTDLVGALAKYTAGDTAQITYNRSGTETTVSLTFDEKVPSNVTATPSPSPVFGGGQWSESGSGT